MPSSRSSCAAAWLSARARPCRTPRSRARACARRAEPPVTWISVPPPAARSACAPVFRNTKACSPPRRPSRGRPRGRRRRSARRRTARRRPAARGADRVDDDVEAAELVPRALHRVGERVRVGRVGLERSAPAPAHALQRVGAARDRGATPAERQEVIEDRAAEVACAEDEDRTGHGRHPVRRSRPGPTAGGSGSRARCRRARAACRCRPWRTRSATSSLTAPTAAANASCGGSGRRRLRVRRPQLRGEAGVHAGAALERERAGGERLDQERAGEVRGVGERPQVGVDRRLQTLGERARSLPGRLEWREQHLDAGVVGGQEAVELVLEVLVERLARDARAADHVGHRRRGVALLGDRGRRSRRSAAPAGRPGPPRVDPVAPARKHTRGIDEGFTRAHALHAFAPRRAASHFPAQASANDDNVAGSVATVNRPMWDENRMTVTRCAAHPTTEPIRAPGAAERRQPDPPYPAAGPSPPAKGRRGETASGSAVAPGERPHGAATAPGRGHDPGARVRPAHRRGDDR